MKKIMLIAMLPLIVEIIVACCDCLEPAIYDYTNCSLTISNLDNSGAEPIVTNLNTILKNAYGIRVSIVREENTCEASRLNSIFIQSSYAFDCLCPPELEYLALDSITSLKIFTLNEFDESHTTDSEISDYFRVFSRDNFSLIDHYINNIGTTLYDFDNPTLEFDLLLMTPPTHGPEHKFQVTILLSDGRELSAQTEILELVE